MAFTTRVKVRFHHSDLAGIMFYGSLLWLVHDVLEDFVMAAGFAWDEWFRNPRWGVPFRKVEAEYVKPHYPGRELEARVTLERLGETSFTWRCRFHDLEGELMSDLRLVNAFVDYATMTKIPMPAEVRQRLEPLLAGGHG